MSKKEKKCCDNCYYSSSFKGHELWFECKRLPPVYVGIGIDSSVYPESWSQPIVINSDWCGEFKPKESESFDIAKNIYNSLSNENKKILSEPYNDRRDNEEE